MDRLGVRELRLTGGEPLVRADLVDIITDLRDLLRSGTDDAAIAGRWQEAMWAEPAAHGMDHTGLDSPDYVQPDRSMSAIGG